MKGASGMESAPALQIENLRKTYGRNTAVADLTLAIEPGEIFGLLGPNGAGKSTTINCVVGVTRADAGRIRVFGHDNRQEYRTTRRLTGVMHQEVVIDHFLPIGQALKFHAGYYGYRTDESWRQMLIERLGLGPHLDKSMNKLSGGLKRRFMVAKAMIHRPPLLILDEPTAGVDVELRHSLWEFVREINAAGTTVLLTTHYLEEAEAMCGRIAIMNHGELVALDHKDALLQRTNRRSLMVHLAKSLDTFPAALSDLTGHLEQDGTCLCLELTAGIDTGALLARISSLGLPIIDVETRQTRLEDIFLELTGLKTTMSQGRQ